MQDLISRSALLDRLTTERFAHYHTVHTDTASLVQHDQEFNVCMGIVFDFPAVDAEVVRHGRWEAVENTGPEEWCAPPIRCSNCGKTMPDVGADFCPFCGQMNAEVEE